MPATVAIAHSNGFSKVSRLGRMLTNAVPAMSLQILRFAIGALQYAKFIQQHAISRLE
ncbi:hypothetical protein SAMN05421881_100742 [Nitrosomonas halophila]|uniref:Uncharacterized protein n=1 Tax=Nitrosomonas halophila TaxID=44576 RepID=A0A1H3E789_9PROT|nr:hypothetical protein SAMN05421881_100742 [Nitrosomonas halophila]